MKINSDKIVRVGRIAFCGTVAGPLVTYKIMEASQGTFGPRSNPLLVLLTYSAPAMLCIIGGSVVTFLGHRIRAVWTQTAGLFACFAGVLLFLLALVAASLTIRPFC